MGSSGEEMGCGEWFMHRERAVQKTEDHMLWTIAVILTVLWLLGLVSSYTMGGLIHLLLVIAVVIVFVNVLTGKRLS